MAHLPLLSIENLVANPGIDGDMLSAIRSTIGAKSQIEFFEDDLFGAGGQWLGAGIGTTAADRIESLGLAVRAYNVFANSQHSNTTATTTTPAEFGNIYKPFLPGDTSEVERVTVTSGLFSNGAGTLTDLEYTSSTLGDTSASYVEVYDKNIDSDNTAQVQFSLGYAHIDGSGSIGNTTKTTAGNRETAALYRQFSNVILPPGTDRFTFTSNPATSGSGYKDFYFLAFNRAQMREKVDPGNWELRIKGSTRTVRLIDDSGATSNPTISQAGRVYNIVSGSIATGTAVIETTAANETTDGAPGLFYPDLGLLIMNRDWLVTNAGGVGNLLPTFSSNTFDNQASKFYNAVSGGLYVAARREEEISSVSYFCRALNTEFNYSSNPTYASSSGDTTGLYTVPSFKSNPRSYITSVGLYAEDGDLVAVAKLSQPQLKSFSREAVIKVKLDY
jgi:hypothetical protein